MAEMTSAHQKVKARLFLAHGTAKALGFKLHQRQSPNETAKNLIWLPKSKVRLFDHAPAVPWAWQEVTVEMPLWLAEQKNLAL